MIFYVRVTFISDVSFGQSNLVVTTDMFLFHFSSNKKRGPWGHLKYGGFPKVWGREWDSEGKLFGEAK